VASNKDSFGRTLFIVVGLCLVCSIFVSGAAVVLKPIQQENKLLDKQKYILEAAGLIDAKGAKVSKQEILDTYGKFVEAKLVDIKTGEFIAGDADSFDQKKAAREVKTSFVPENDIASVKRVSDTAVVYLIHDEQSTLKSVILPIHGYGLWSTMYAFLALDSDLNTVQSLVYYDHGETPGLGGEVQNQNWKAKWNGKKLFDEQGDIAISITKNPAIASTEYGVDGLSGATLTSNGVQNSLAFWLGKEGFASFIEKARNGGLD
jgi:Na+-transporting NADH:ubiquinone oxidoreductase subunit C